MQGCPIAAGFIVKKSAMKKIFIFLLVGACFSAGCITPGKFFPEKPVQKIPYILVYGRENCSACKTVKRKLEDAQVGRNAFLS